MSNTNQNTETKNRPSHVVKALQNPGRRDSYFERIGVAFDREDGSGFYVKLAGTQIIDSGFYLFPMEEAAEEQGAGQ